MPAQMLSGLCAGCFFMQHFLHCCQFIYSAALLVRFPSCFSRNRGERGVRKPLRPVFLCVGKADFLIIKVAKIKDKEKLLKAAREKRQITYKGIPIRLTVDLSAETLQARREWQDILKVIKEKNLQPRLLYPARISFRFDGEIKTFTYKQKLREFSTTKPALQQMLKELF